MVAVVENEIVIKWGDEGLAEFETASQSRHQRARRESAIVADFEKLRPQVVTGCGERVRHEHAELSNAQQTKLCPPNTSEGFDLCGVHADRYSMLSQALLRSGSGRFGIFTRRSRIASAS